MGKRMKRKKSRLIYTQIYCYQNKEEIVLAIIVLVSVPGDTVLGGIYNYRLLQLIPASLRLQRTLELIIIPCLLR